MYIQTFVANRTGQGANNLWFPDGFQMHSAILTAEHSLVSIHSSILMKKSKGMSQLSSWSFVKQIPFLAMYLSEVRYYITYFREEMHQIHRNLSEAICSMEGPNKAAAKSNLLSSPRTVDEKRIQTREGEIPIHSLHVNASV